MWLGPSFIWDGVRSDLLSIFSPATSLQIWVKFLFLSVFQEYLVVGYFCIMDINSTSVIYSTSVLTSASTLQPSKSLYSVLFSWYVLCSAAIGVAVWQSWSSYKGNSLVHAPFIGSRFAWLARLDYFIDAKRVINAGYAQCKESIFKICGNDVIVLPNKYVDELRNIPNDRLNAILALVKNAEGAFALTDVLATSNLHTTVIQTRLTPKLGALVPSVRNELDIALDIEFPRCDKTWVNLEIYHVLHQIVGRASARVFVGPDLCRNKSWLETAEGYTNNVFITIVALRLLPFWAKPFVHCCLPSSWKIYYHWWRAKRQLLPLIAQRRMEKDIHLEQKDEGLGNFLQMLMDEADNGPDSDPVTIAKRVLSLTLASNHTTTMALVEALYDLCAHPEHIEELREEVQQAVSEDGGWRKTTLTKMRKLDSFMKESQRVNPPSYSKQNSGPNN